MNELSIHILAPTGTIWKGAAKSVSSRNDTGAFDILPRHAPFITIALDSLTIRPTGGGQPINIPIEEGVIRCRSDQVVIHLGLKTSAKPASQTKSPPPPLPPSTRR